MSNLDQGGFRVEMWGVLVALFRKKTFIAIGILKYFSSCRELFIPVFWTSVISKVLIPTMRKFRLVCCLYRTPIPLSSRSNFDRISSKPIKITTIEAVNFLDDIQVIEKSTLIEKIIFSFDDWNMVKRETYPLIEGNNEVKKKRKRKDAINKRNREKMPNIRWNNVFPSWELKSTISFSKFIKKNDLSFLEFKTIFFCESIIFSSEFDIEFLDFFQYFSDRCVHSYWVIGIFLFWYQ